MKLLNNQIGFSYIKINSNGFYLVLFCFFCSSTFGQSVKPKLGFSIGHNEFIKSFEFSPAGNFMVTSADDGNIKLWEINTGRTIHNIVAHNDRINSTNFNVKGNFLITSSDDNSSKVWNVETGKLLYALKHNDDVIYSEFNFDDEYIVTVTRNNLVSIWSCKSKVLIITFSGERARFIKGSTNIIVETNDKKLTFYDFQKKKEIKTLKWNYYTGSDVSPNGKYIAVYFGTVQNFKTEIYDTNSYQLLYKLNEKYVQIGADDNLITLLDNKIRVTNLNTKEGLDFITKEEDISGVFYEYNNNRIIYEGNESKSNSINIRDIISNQSLSSQEFPEYSIIDFKVSPNDNYIAVLTNENKIQILNYLSADIISTLNEFPFARMARLDKKCNLIISSSSDVINVWNLSDGELRFSANGKIYDIDLDNEKIAVVFDDKTINIYDLYSKQLIQSINESSDRITAIKFSPVCADDLNGGENLAVAKTNGQIKIFDTNHGNLVKTLKDLGSINSLDFSSNRKYLVSARFGNKATVWDFSTEKVINQIEGEYSLKPTIVSTCPLVSGKDNTNYLVLLVSGEQVSIWNSKSGHKLYSLRATIAKFSPNGKYIATSSYGGEITILDASTGTKLQEFTHHNGSLNYIAFSDDSNFIATSSVDKTVKIWNISLGSMVNSFNHSNEVLMAEFGSDNNKSSKIISSSRDGAITIWDRQLNAKVVQQFLFEERHPIWLLPNGYYFSSKKASSKLYYVDGSQTVGFEQLDIKYNRPDKVLKNISSMFGNVDKTMVMAYKRAWQKRIEKLKIDTLSFESGFSVPKSDFANRKTIDYEQSSNQLQLKIQGVDSLNKLVRFNVWVNEVPVYGSNGINIQNRQSHHLDTTITLTLSNGKNKIETSVHNANGIESYRLPLYINNRYKSSIEKIYFVGIGVNKHLESGHDLNYSVKDIKDLAGQFLIKYNGRIEIDTLFNENVSIDKILKLKRKLLESNVNDKVIICFSGHGLLSDDLDYYLATYNVSFRNPEQNGLPYDKLEFLIDGIPSRQKILLIDACHSGEVDKNEIEKIKTIQNQKLGLKGSEIVVNKSNRLGLKNSFELMKELFVNVDRATGATVISAAGGTQFAQERANLENGVFTYSILEQLRDKKNITVSELKKNIGERVIELTNGLQQPTSRNETIEHDWTVW